MQRDDDEGVDTLAESIAEERGQARGGREEPEEEETEVEETEELETPEDEAEEESEAEEEVEAAGPDDTEDEEETEDEGQEERARSKGRGSERIRRQAEELSRLRAENETLRRGGGTDRPARPAADPQAMRKAITDDITKTLGEGGLALMTPAQQAQFIAGSIERVMTPVMRQFAGSVGANQDRQQFRENYGSDPKYAPFFKRFSAQVETKFADAQAQGFFIPREQFFKELVADAVLKGLDKGGGKQRRERDIRRIKAGGSPTKGRGDVGGGKRRETRVQTLERRLAGVKI